MTRARALKTIIRARVAKTGERYTTARRQVLKNLPAKSPVAVAVPIAAPPAPAARSSTAATASTKGGLSDAKSREKTGHGLDHWFALLDRFDGVAKGHTAAARHLHEAHGIDGWYAQGITVAYERARGVRAVNQRCDGEYEVSASKVVSAPTKDIVKAFADARERRSWTDGLESDLVSAMSAGFSARTAKGFTVKPNGQAYARFKWNGTTVLVQLWPNRKGKISVTVTNGKLANAEMVEERRAKWRAALGALATFLSA
jgi:hypothetical protein